MDWLETEPRRTPVAVLFKGISHSPMAPFWPWARPWTTWHKIPLSCSCGRHSNPSPDDATSQEVFAPHPFRKSHPWRCTASVFLRVFPVSVKKFLNFHVPPMEALLFPWRFLTSRNRSASIGRTLVTWQFKLRQFKFRQFKFLKKC